MEKVPVSLRATKSPNAAEIYGLANEIQDYISREILRAATYRPAYGTCIAVSLAQMNRPSQFLATILGLSDT